MGIRDRGRLGPEVWIEREDCEPVPPKGFFRLYPPQTQADGSVAPGNKVRLKSGMVVECTGFELGAGGRLATVRARLVPGLSLLHL